MLRGGLPYVIGCILFFSAFAQAAFAQDSGPNNCARVFTGGPGVNFPPDYQYNFGTSVPVDINGQKYDVGFDGHIENATANIENRSIQFDASGSALIVRLPKALIDSAKDNQTMPFTVIINGQPSKDAKEDVVPTSGDRLVCFSLPDSNSQSKVEIIGTTIAPEFGSVALVIVSMTLVGLIAFRAIYGSRT